MSKPCQRPSGRCCPLSHPGPRLRRHASRQWAAARARGARGDVPRPWEKEEEHAFRGDACAGRATAPRTG
eukprot:1611896-Alexandrium_andersonii.AAC.1